MKATVPRILFIVGQTASGKSALAQQIAEKHNGEIICADSLTVYKGLDIGTAKPSKKDQSTVRHHLLDVASPEYRFNVADFQRLAEIAIRSIEKQKCLPIVVGGSGLYVDSVLFQYALQTSHDVKLREELNTKSIPELQSLIRKYGYQMPENLNNKRYLIRTIERKGAQSKDTKMRNGALVVGIHREKRELEARIRKRITAMIKAGVIDEAQQAFRNFPANSEALKGNIYQVLRHYFSGDITIDQALETCIQADLQLAKKQYTWFKRNQAIHWFNNTNTARSFIETHL